ncbi:hypothetical protein LZD49_03880 [Dyadobacter sp. CY261]|uniref:hypothetical protein n=1 Tax=Dyadobacter sp. CY261 TaxID=2907203 RepID=UPI001F2B947B|nr:hypothetical protein [Dyadobacter sp. CY261]MCF0069596.1 hypothetical protein [Dyadobacter sp. CY261]
MARPDNAIDRLKRFNSMKSVRNARRVNLGLRFSVDQLLQLATALTGKRALLVDEPPGARPSLKDAELVLATRGKPPGNEYRMSVSKVSVQQAGVTNENTDPNSRFNATRFPKATGVVFMVGKEPGTMALTVDDFPVVGDDVRGPSGVLPDWDFIIHLGRRAWSFSDGGGGPGSKTPPPGS